MTADFEAYQLPWTIEAGNPFWERGPAIINNQGIRIAYIEGAPLIPHDKDEAHATFILTAANLHHELVEALEAALTLIPAYIIGGEHEKVWRLAYAALAKAKEDT